MFLSKIARATAVGVVVSLALAGCGGSDDGSDDASSSTIRLAHDADSANLPVWVALEKGFFEERGLDIEFTEVQNIGPLPTALGKSFDIVETPITALATASEQGIGIQAIAANGGVETADSPTASLLVLKSSGITSVNQLEGKVLGAITISGTIHLDRTSVV